MIQNNNEKMIVIHTDYHLLNRWGNLGQGQWNSWLKHRLKGKELPGRRQRPLGAGWEHRRRAREIFQADQQRISAAVTNFGEHTYKTIIIGGNKTCFRVRHARRKGSCGRRYIWDICRADQDHAALFNIWEGTQCTALVRDIPKLWFEGKSSA